MYAIRSYYEFNISIDPLTYKKTIFYKALDYLVKMDEGIVTSDHILLTEHYKDPFVYLLNLTLRRTNENDFNYFSRLQDETPLKINNNFLEGPRNNFV